MHSFGRLRSHAWWRQGAGEALGAGRPAAGAGELAGEPEAAGDADGSRAGVAVGSGVNPGWRASGIGIPYFSMIMFVVSPSELESTWRWSWSGRSANAKVAAP